jgi:hypothetical protein
MDVLAVPITCGSGDLRFTSNFSFKPIQIQVFEPSQETNTLVEEHLNEYGTLKNQRSLDTFRIKDIKKERELKAIPDYKPNFVNFPITFEEITVELNECDLEKIAFLRKRQFPGTDEEIIRAAVMSWYLRNKRAKNWDLYRGSFVAP